MRISDVQAYPLSVPLKSGDLPSPVAVNTAHVITRITTDEGITGIGEAWGFNAALLIARTIDTSLRRLLIGKDPLQIEKIWQELYRATYYYGRVGAIPIAISGVEMALWDIAGKAYDIPLYQMLGGCSHERLQAYASLLPYTWAQDLADACKILKKKGYTAIKLHEKDPLAVGAARNAVGDDTLLLLDVNCAWEAPKAIEMAARFKPFNLHWYEEPVWPCDNYEALLEMHAMTGIPLATGENYYTVGGFKELIVRRAVDYVQPSVDKVGGIAQTKKVLSLAQAFGIKGAPHCWSWGPARAATLHICFSEPGCELMETSVDTPVASILSKPLLPEKGFWKALEKPGLGIELDEDVLTKYLVKD